MKKIYSLIIIYLIMCCVLLENAYALDGSKSTKNCRFKANTSDTMNVVFATNPNDLNKSKRGMLYSFNDNGNNLFCLIPNIPAARYYDMYETPISTSGLEEYYYKIYGWYTQNGITEYKQRWAQVAMWYIAYCVENNKTPDATELGVAYTTAEMSEDCYRYEGNIRAYLNNPYFSCSSYFAPDNTNFRLDLRFGDAERFTYTDYFDLFYNETTYRSCDKETLKQYAMAFFNVPASSIETWYNDQVRYPIIKKCNNGRYYTDGVQYARECSVSFQVNETIRNNALTALDILRHDKYTGELYYWYPHGHKARCISSAGKALYSSCDYQVLVGIYGCDHGDSTCQDGLNQIVNNHRTDASGLTLSNSSYINDLTNYQRTKQTEIDASWLTDAEWVSNPTCGGFECVTDLNKLKSMSPSSSEYTAWHNVMVGRNNAGLYQDAAYNNNAENPECGGTPPPPPPKCEASFTYSDCDNFTNVNNGFRISDTDIEDCWQNQNISFSANTITKESKWDDGSNRYCDVYCWEAAGADFPGAIKDIQAGQRFFWGRGTEDDGYFGNINASRKCITKNINYQLYYNDVVANETDISRKYDQVMADADFNSKNSTEVTGSGKDCTTSDTTGCNGHNEPVSCSVGQMLEDGTCFTFTHLPTGHSPAVPHGKCNDGSSPIRIKKKDSATYDYVCGYSNLGPASGGGGFVCDSCPSGYKLQSGNCYKEGTYYKKTQSTYGTASVAENKVCIANDVADKVAAANAKLKAPDTEAHKTALGNALNKRTDIQKEIKDCQSNGNINYDPDHGNTNMYTYSTTVKLTYGEKFWNGGASAPSPKTISGNDLLIQDGQVYSFSSSGNRENTSILTTDGVTQTGVENVVTICTDVSGVYGDNYFGCTKNADGSILYAVPVYANYTWNFAGYWKYKYNNQYFVWHFLKQSGIAKMKKEITTTDFTFGGKYGFIASFNMVTNFYSFATVEVKGFGNNGHFNELYQELSAEYIPAGTSTDTYTYICPFHIENKMYGSECHYDCNFETKVCTLNGVSPEYCKNKVGGIDLVYRIIQLTSAEQAAAGNKNIVFPGLVGTGRSLGSNWEVFYNNNRTKYNNITTYSNIYDGGAIYVIDLTPAAIQAIRADNAEYRAKKKDPYTSMKDPNNNQKIKCTGETPQEQTCVSTWITDLKNGKVGAVDIGVKLTGEYGELDTDARLAAIKRAKESTEASGTKNLLSTGGV